MKGFVVGLLSGVALYGAGDALLGSDALQRLKVEAPSAVSAPSTQISHGLANGSVATSAHAYTEARTEAHIDRSAETPPSAVLARDCISVDDSNLDRVISELSQRRSRAEQASLEAEPRDPLWADSTEQQLRQLIARHPNGHRFAVKTLYCRTLYCEIAVEGFESDESDDPQIVFNSVIKEVQEQLGLGVGLSGSARGETAIEMHARLRRFKIGDQCPPGLRQDCWNR